VEGDDPTDLAQHVAEWADVIDLEVNPVVEDAAAAEAASRVFGKIASNCNLMLSERRRVREYFSCAAFCFRLRSVLETLLMRPAHRKSSPRADQLDLVSHPAIPNAASPRFVPYRGKG